MGTDFSNTSKSRLKIHEYASLSIPPYPHFKNLVKRNFQTKPHLRIFQTMEIARQFNFKDQIPFCLRGAGIANSFLQSPPTQKKEYDFIYIGDISKVRKSELLLHTFRQNFENHTLLLVGKTDPQLRRKYENRNLQFTGQFPYHEIPQMLRLAEYGLNFIPNVYPYNIQPSYKLLEYCAAGLKVITTDYKWVREFEQKHQAKFFKLNVDLSNLEYSQLEQFNFIKPSLEEYQWEKVIKRAKILPKIEELYIKLTKGLS